MKKVSFCLLLFFIADQLLAQDTINKKDESVHHNFIINIVPDQYNKPLIGLANIAKGNHKGFHLSFINWNQKDFDGLQLSFINFVGGSVKGSQIGIINFCAHSLTGVQIGFVNYCDTIAKGLSFGEVTIERKGFQALEVGISEMYPINISYKMGNKRFYNSVNFSCNNDGKAPVFGFGFGSLISLKKSFFFNPDFSYQNGILKGKQDILSLVAKLSYGITKHIHISAGPSFVWNHANRTELRTPIYSMYENSINSRNSIVMGLRCSLRYIIKGL